MKKILIALSLLPLLNSCDLIQQELEKKLIWTDSSESITITTYTANTLGDVQTPPVSFTKEELPMVASDLLSTIRTTFDDLTCQEDGTTYTFDIVDEDGSTDQYYSDNADCNDNEFDFISTEHIEDLVQLLI